MRLTPSEQIMYNVLHITMLDNANKQLGTATGFLFGFCTTDKGSSIALVTNRHVLANCPRIKLAFTRRKDDGTPDIGNLIEVIFHTQEAIFHPNPDIDLAILPISRFINGLFSAGKSPFFVVFTTNEIPTEEDWKSFSAIENVVMAGFPKGFRDEINNQPIIRSGITATHPALDFKGKSEFLVDMPCFEGCSGSPVLICNEGWLVDKRHQSIKQGTSVKLLGIQYAIPSNFIVGHLATVKTADTIAPVVPLYMNLGFIIKSTELLAFESLIQAQLNAEAAAVS